jgi:hypothetical protein
MNKGNEGKAGIHEGDWKRMRVIVVIVSCLILDLFLNPAQATITILRPKTRPDSPTEMMNIFPPASLPFSQT